MLDVNDGVVLFPGVTQLGQAGGSVVLQAQVSGTTVSSYSWNTTNLTSATSITGASTYQLSFRWNNEIVTNQSDSVTLSVEDTNSHIKTYTYDFEVLLGTGGGGSGGSGGSGGGITTMTWPSTYAPNTVSMNAPEWQSHGVSVNANSGALDTSINLPSYNPNVPAVSLDYDSITANPLPIIVAENPLSSSTAVPSQVSAVLTFNGTAGTRVLLQHEHLEPGRRPADRPPGPLRGLDRSVFVLDAGRGPILFAHHDRLHRHGHGAQRVEQLARRRLVG